MLVKHLFLVFLLSLVNGQININIKIAETAAKASVSYFGENVAIINDQDRKVFKLSDEALKEAANLMLGKSCTDVFVKSPTPWGDAYQRFGWKQVKRTLKPVKTRILSVDVKPRSIATEEYVNTQPRLTDTYSTSITQIEEETLSHTWTKEEELEVEQEISYNLNFGTENIGNTTTLSYTSKWGNETTQSISVTIGATSSVETSVAPGQGVLAALIAMQGTMTVEVEYEATLDGKVFCNYDTGHRGDHYWPLPMTTIQTVAKLPKSIKSVEEIKIGFYTNARIDVSDLKTKATIKKIPAGIIKVNGMNREP